MTRQLALASRRKRLGIKQSEMANFLNRHAAAVSSIENGEFEITEAECERLEESQDRLAQEKAARKQAA